MTNRFPQCGRLMSWKGIVWVTAAVAALALSGCGKEEAGTTSTQAVSTEGKSAAQVAVEAATPMCEG